MKKELIDLNQLGITRNHPFQSQIRQDSILPTPLSTLIRQLASRISIGQQITLNG